jgi:hypothetical protein
MPAINWLAGHVARSCKVKLLRLIPVAIVLASIVADYQKNAYSSRANRTISIAPSFVVCPPTKRAR